MTSSPITSWQIDGETMETVSDFIFLVSKITADGDCSHEIKRCLLLGRKVMTNLDSILKSRAITLPTKVHLVKALVFFSIHVWSWDLDYKESWAEHRRIDAFELRGVGEDSWVFLGLQGDQISFPKGNQSWIFIRRKDVEVEAPIFWPPNVRNWLIRKDMMLG